MNINDEPSVLGKNKRNRDDYDDLPSLLNDIIGDDNQSKKKSRFDIGKIEDISLDLKKLITELDNKLITLSPTPSDTLRITPPPLTQELIVDYTKTISNINTKLSESEKQLPLDTRIALTNKIVQLINTAVTNQQITEELQNDAQWKNNIEGLFNSIIVFYTEMASYTKERTPEMLANIGSAIAGTVLIGGVLFTVSNNGVSSGDGMASILLRLSKYINTGAGLFFLQKSGLPIYQNIIDLGKNITNCVSTNVNNVCTKENFNYAVGTLYSIGLNHLQNLINDDYSNIDLSSVSSSTKSNKSTSSNASSVRSDAKSRIEGILETPKNEQQVVLYQPPSEIDLGYNSQPSSQLSNSQASLEDWSDWNNIEEDESINPMQSQNSYNSLSEAFRKEKDSTKGGKYRSYRNKKTKKTKKNKTKRPRKMAQNGGKMTQKRVKTIKKIKMTKKIKIQYRKLKKIQ
jgi:hypothetical protein